MRLFAAILATCASIGIAATPANARDFDAYQSTLPILYRYAACAFALEEPSAEGQLAECEGLRAQLEQTADEVLPRFQSRDRIPALRGMREGFQEIEREAGLARQQRKTVPPAIIDYLRCMGESVMQTEDYQMGVAVDYIGIEERCVTDNILSVTSVRTEQELERIQLLYQRFARSGRYIDNSRLGSGIASTADGANARRRARNISRSRASLPPFYRMDGFLLLHRLPADELPND